MKEVGNGEQEAPDSQFAVNPEDSAVPQETSVPPASVDLQEVVVMDDPQNKSEHTNQNDTEKNNFYLFNQFLRDVQDEKAGERADEDKGRMSKAVVPAMAVQQSKSAGRFWPTTT